MSKRVLSMTLAAMTTALTVGAASVEAAVTAKQVRRIAKQEVAKRLHNAQGPAGGMGAQGPTGPAGPQGPGANGFRFLFAHIDSDGFVDPSTSAGIAQQNVRRVDVVGNNSFEYTYCFSGLPPVNGGQVTLSGPVVGGVVMTAYLQITDDTMCSPRVVVTDSVNQAGVGASFHILLY